MRSNVRIIVVLSVLVILSVLIFAFTFDQNNQVNQLERYLQRMREIEKKGGWPIQPIGDTLKSGVRSDRVELLRKRLSVTGEFGTVKTNLPDSFDTDLQQAVIRFQRQHALPATGMADRRTIREMNVSVQYRIHQIELNIERWKTMPSQMEELCILVNLPSGRLDVLENNKSVLDMQIIVGRFYRKTPLFNAMVTDIEFHPYWIVPPNMMKKDILPRVKADPAYIRQNRMIVYQDGKKVAPETIDWGKVSGDSIPYKIMQRPGPDNPLGVVKFIFPNKYFVFMHDTPGKELFESDRRTYSSGCIRLSKATELAKYLLKPGGNWTAERIDSLIRAEKNTRVKLETPVKIYICYFTAWINQQGELQLAPDIYKRDI